MKPNLSLAWVLIAVASFITRIIGGYDRAGTDVKRADYLAGITTWAIAIVVLLSLAFVIYSTLGKATFVALRFDNPDAILFRSSPAAITKLAVRRLQKLADPVQPNRFLTVYSPSVVIQPTGLSIWRGTGQPERVLFVPRALISAVAITEVRDGFLTSPALQFTVRGESGGTLLSLPVLRDSSALRAGAPEDIAELADRIRDLYDLSRADAELPPGA